MFFLGFFLTTTNVHDILNINKRKELKIELDFCTDII